MNRLTFPLLALLLATTAPTAALAQEKITLRGDDHDGYQRLVFDWNAAPSYDLDQQSGNVTLTFNKQASADVSSVSALDNVTNMRVVRDDASGLVMAFEINPQSKLRHFQAGNRIIVDIYDAPGGTPTPEAEIKPEPVPEPVVVKEEKPVEPVTEEPKEEIKATETPAATMPEVPVEEVAAETVAAPAIEPHVMTITSTKALGVAIFERGPWLWIIVDDPEMNVPPVIAGPTPEVFGEIERMRDIQGVTAYRMQKPPRANIIAEGGGLFWRLVFSPNPKEVQSIVPQKRVAVPPETEGGTRKGSSLFWPLGEVKKIYSFTDPEMGDEITVALVPDAGGVVRQEYDFVELETLPSIVGLAYLPLVDDVSASVLPEGVSINRGTQDMTLSLDTQTQSAAIKEAMALEATFDVDSNIDEEISQPSPADNPNVLYHLSRWQMGGLPALRQNQSVLMSGLAGKDVAGRAEGLLTLAKLMIANDRGIEAMGYLRAAGQIYPDILENPEFSALRGVASVLAGQPDRGIEDMMKASLNRFMDVPYWRAAALAGLEDWQQAIAVMPESFDFLADYPQDIQERLALILAEIALRDADTQTAESLLAMLEPATGEMSASHHAAWNYLMGETARQMDKPEAAIEYWTPLVDGKDDYYHAKAGLSLTQLKLDEKMIEPADAVDRLERLRYAWRGDELETLINYRLGKMYVGSNDYLKGLHVLRNAASFSPESEMAKEVTDYMTTSFDELFNSGALQNVSALDAVSVYEEFKELTPTGAEGDRIVEQLAERLVEADLLGRAADLLNYQVTHRLQGVEAGRVAVRLAGIRLLDDKPEGAMRALDVAEEKYKDGQDGAVPPEKAREIAFLRARAYSKMNQPDQAMALLENLPEDRNLARLRADVAWKNQQWPEAAAALQDLIAVEAVVPNKPLTVEQADLILNRAIALNLAGDRVALATMRQRYAAQMKETDKGEMFDVITLPRQMGIMRSRESIAEMINNVDLFKEFLDSYRESTN